jgi:hypothetical protein
VNEEQGLGLLAATLLGMLLAVIVFWAPLLAWLGWI